MTLLERSLRTNAAVLTGVVLLSGCGQAATGDGTTAEPISIAIGEPVSPLLPGTTVEENGTQILEALWTGLVECGTDGAVRYTGMAEAIESGDSVTWTVRLRDGWTLHDGTSVTAGSFVDAWNYAAYSPNAQEGSSFFANIEGYGGLQAPVDDAGEPTGDPAATELSGLYVVDDETFTVALSAPFAQFPVTLGYNPFFPLPESFFEDPEAFGLRPIGNGPFRAAGDFVPGRGPDRAALRGLRGRAGGLGRADRVPRLHRHEHRLHRRPGRQPRRPAPGSGRRRRHRAGGVRGPVRRDGGLTFLGLPLYQERYADARVRQALSLAIDRELIAEQIFSGTRQAATSLVPPVVEGHRADACGYCALDVDRANDPLDEARFDRTQPIELWFNAGGGNEAWVEAVGNQLRTHLGVEFVLKGDLAPPEYGPLLGTMGMTGPFRMGWSMDYPSPQNFLEPLYATDAGTNFTFYSDPEFDALLAKGNAAATGAEAIGFYNQAEDVVLEDMPIIPLFFAVTQSVHSADVADVVVDVCGRVDTSALTAAG